MSKFVILLLGLLGSAIGLPADQQDVSSWAASTLALGSVAWATTEFLKKHVLKGIDGIQVMIVAVASAVALAVGLGVGEALDGSIVEWLAFGLSAGLSAIGIDLGLKKVGAGKSEPVG